MHGLGLKRAVEHDSLCGGVPGVKNMDCKTPGKAKTSLVTPFTNHP